MLLRFFGAAGNVTGSCYLLEVNGARLLIDCGMYQERNLQERNWLPFPVPPDSVHALLLTHAHIDHSGLTPKFYKDGFSGQTFATPATIDLAEILLLDSAHIQEEDTRFKRSRHRVEGRRPKEHPPLYTEQDVYHCLPRLRSVPYERKVEVADGVTATWHDAGHILGSAHIRLEVRQGSNTTVILFSGDIGHQENPILANPTTFDHADIVIVESTYGDRLHDPRETAERRLAEAVRGVVEQEGNLVIPSFAVGRTQELLFFFKRLLSERTIPELPTFVDSPMAIRATEVFHRHPECWNDDFADRMFSGEDPLDFPKVHFTRDAEESRSIALYPPSNILISAAGMCNAGRIKHHLVNNIGDAASTILFIGYQASGTLGRAIVEGENPVRILGADRKVRASIESISGFSAHGDAQGLLDWMTSLRDTPRHVFVVHGEPTSAEAFRRKLGEHLSATIHVPQWGEEFAFE